MLERVRNKGGQRRYQSLVILFVFLLSTLTATVISTIKPQTASAISMTQAQIDFCVKTYPAGTVIEDKGVDTTGGQYVKNNCGLICNTQVSGGESASVGLDPTMYQIVTVLSCNAAATPDAPAIIDLATIKDPGTCTANAGTWDTQTNTCSPKLPQQQQDCKDAGGTKFLQRGKDLHETHADKL